LNRMKCHINNFFSILSFSILFFCIGTVQHWNSILMPRWKMWSETFSFWHDKRMSRISVFYFTINFSWLANKALLIVCICAEITLNTDKSIRLNSSKQPQAPDRTNVWIKQNINKKNIKNLL
jgi:hypothetical protein